MLLCSPGRRAKPTAEISYLASTHGLSLLLASYFAAVIRLLSFICVFARQIQCADDGDYEPSVKQKKQKRNQKKKKSRCGSASPPVTRCFRRTDEDKKAANDRHEKEDINFLPPPPHLAWDLCKYKTRTDSGRADVDARCRNWLGTRLLVHR